MKHIGNIEHNITVSDYEYALIIDALDYKECEDCSVDDKIKIKLRDMVRDLTYMRNEYIKSLKGVN